MNNHKITLFVVVFCFTTKFLHSQTVKSIIKQIEKTQKSYKAYELKYDSYFKFFDNKDTSHLIIHQKSKNFLRQLDFGWQKKHEDTSVHITYYDGTEILSYYNKNNAYYSQSIKNNFKNFSDEKNRLTYKPLNFYLKSDKFQLLNSDSKYHVLIEIDSSTDRSLNLFSSKQTILYVNKSTFFIDTFIRKVLMTGQEQFEKLVLIDIKHLNKNEIKNLLKENDSIRTFIKTKLNGDSIIAELQKNRKKMLEKGDTFSRFIAQIHQTNDSINLPNFNDSIIILDFFYTSCGPCIAAIPYLKQIDSIFKNKGVKLYGIDPYPYDWKKLDRFVVYHQLNYPVLLVDNNIAREVFGVSGYPTLFIIKNNQVMFQHLGFTTDITQILTIELNKLINK